MEHRIEFTVMASLQAEQAREWIAERSPERAARWERGLFETLETIRNLPGRCPVASESADFGVEVRELLYGKRQGMYRILYIVRGDVILVVAIRHALRA